MLRYACLTVLTLTASVLAAEPKDKTVPAALNYEVQSLDGKSVNLADYQGKVLLVVNVASECGATPQYADLQRLYQEHKGDGLVVLGFPCNQFGAQEPGSAEEITAFCTREYSVTFPMFAKIDVNGPQAAPFYKYLTSQTTRPKGTGNIGWNFEKFLISRDGQVVARFGTGTEPTDAELAKAVQAELVKPLSTP
ncbi:MAG: glutathione peroxidase [Planctomycetaceae bacterium]